MALIAVIAVVFIVLLVLPFAVSLLALRKSREASLYVKGDNVRDPRYFSNSFRDFVEKGLDRQNRTIKMSKMEPFVYAEELTDDTCNTIVIAENHFQPSNVSIFTKEIYAASSAKIPPGTRLRAIACLGTLELGQNCEVVRWADSEKQMTIADGCFLGVSTTSAARLLIAPGCTFHRLYAPEIIIGYHTERTVRFPFDTGICKERWIDPEQIEPGATVRNTIVTGYSLEIGESAIVLGSIKSNNHIFIHRNVCISGNVVADGAIMIEEGARILGTVFSQDSILVGPGVEIGMKPKIKSLIARKSIVLCETASIFGYVGCEVDSVTIAKEDFQSELSQKRWTSKMETIKAEIAEEMAEDRIKSPVTHCATEDTDE